MADRSLLAFALNALRIDDAAAAYSRLIASLPGLPQSIIRYGTFCIALNALEKHVRELESRGVRIDPDLAASRDVARKLSEALSALGTNESTARDVVKTATEVLDAAGVRPKSAVPRFVISNDASGAGILIEIPVGVEIEEICRLNNALAERIVDSDLDRSGVVAAYYRDTTALALEPV